MAFKLRVGSFRECGIRALGFWELGLRGALGDIDPLNKVPFKESHK